MCACVDRGRFSSAMWKNMWPSSVPILPCAQEMISVQFSMTKESSGKKTGAIHGSWNKEILLPFTFFYLRMQHKELFGPWLLRQINSNIFEGVLWLNLERTLFRIPWKHLNIKTKEEKDYGIFKAWAIESGKYNKKYENPTSWKTNFRCALKSVTCNDMKMFTEVEDNSSSQEDPHKIYRVNIVPAVLLNPATSYTASSTPTTNLAEQNILNMPEENDEETLLISPNNTVIEPFDVNGTELDLLEEILRNTNIYSDTATPFPTVNSQNGFPQENGVLNVDHQLTNGLYMEQSSMWPITNGYEPSVPAQTFNGAVCSQGVYVTQLNTSGNSYQQEQPVQGLGQQASHYVYKEISTLQPITNSFVPSVHSPALVYNHQIYPQASEPDLYDVIQNQPHVNEVYKPATNGIYQDPTERETHARTVEPAPPAVTNACVDSLPNPEPPQTTSTEKQCHGSSPLLTSWEVTVFYKGKQVLQKNVSTKFVINTGVMDSQMGPVDIVCLPSTDDLVDQTQINLTKTILDNVGGGLQLEVSPQDYKLHATRVGKSRVYWSMSGGLDIMGNPYEGILLKRGIQAEIFDFRKFWEDLGAYKMHQRQSPDYTIYMSFGQSLTNPIMRRLVLVKTNRYWTGNRLMGSQG
uniref:Interferon regulatory factor 7 n=1 Tax=Xenopus tropicalis TaxID=8364 RepID=F7ELL0_XENTR